MLRQGPGLGVSMSYPDRDILSVPTTWGNWGWISFPGPGRSGHPVPAIAGMMRGSDVVPSSDEERRVPSEDVLAAKSSFVEPCYRDLLMALFPPDRSELRRARVSRLSEQASWETNPWIKTFSHARGAVPRWTTT